MADWRQIQARIRKAKNSPEALAKLSDLYRRTRDAMVAWELAAIEEKAEHKDEAVNWYTIAARRFRRPDWKKKAQEALARLGIEFSPEAAETGAREFEEHVSEKGGAETAEAAQSLSEEVQEPQPLPLALGEIPAEAEPMPSVEAQAEGEGGVTQPGKKRRRRGRRGGRGRRRKGAAGVPGLPAQAFAAPQAPPAERQLAEMPARGPVTPELPALELQGAPAVEAARIESAIPQLPSERTARGRAGDPALASRMAYLESLLRRLVSSPLHRLDKADEAPAGPGVLLLSDSDLITSYYVEACQTLRVGFANLVRGKAGRKGREAGESSIKARLAEHLGINEAKVTQYMKDHCVVRWMQLDDDAPALAHFAIGVLRTPLNLD